MVNFGTRKIQDSLGKELCSSILFCHAFLGCDTTSKPFGKGKCASLKLQNTNSDFKIVSKIFYESESTKQDIDTAGENAMCIVYGGLVIDGIDRLRYQIFQKKVNNAKLSKSIIPEELPPTQAALKFHSRRAYFQVFKF